MDLTQAQPRAEVIIDRDALAANYRTLTRLAPKSNVACAIKADAYGLGAEAVGPRLAREGAKTFYVASLEEGVALRIAFDAAGYTTPEILIFSGFWPAFADLYTHHRLSPVINYPEQLKAFQAHGGGAAALFLDTGMNRLGFSPEDARALAHSPSAFEGIGLTRIISHMACGDEASHAQNAAQHTLFTELTSQLPQTALSLANTATTLLGERYHFDEIRPGVGLYGASPVGLNNHPFQPVVTIRAPILQIRPLGPDQPVGYGASYHTDAAKTLATIALGYGDGLLRSTSPGGYGLVKGARAPFLGRISMDFSVIDVTGLDVKVGDHVEILGGEIDRLAAAAHTIGYEYLTRLGSRLARVYRGAP
ncbi:alanine racemase [Woodsholea maritima]|uniref:alanine racemase n=1 Tax=Woodsholea maritima TaxID=240237 RepID=UPI0003634502|nr:alanine racemase [Woodsholea maritima]